MTKTRAGSRSRTTPGPDQRELADFFGLLAARFAYERDTSDTSGTVAARPAVIRPARLRSPLSVPRSQRTLVWLAATLLGLLLIASGTLPIWRRSVPLPDNMLGSWNSAAVGYADRGFTLSPTMLVLKAGVGGLDITSHPISRVLATQNGAETLYNIEYLVDGEPVEFPLRYSPGPPAEIHLAHQQEIVWTRGAS